MTIPDVNTAPSHLRELALDAIRRARLAAELEYVSASRPALDAVNLRECEQWRAVEKWARAKLETNRRSPKTDKLYSIDDIKAWIEENPGGNDWLVEILRDGERGIARVACGRAVAEADAQDTAGASEQ